MDYTKLSSEELLQKLDQLQARVAELEANESVGAATSSATRVTDILEGINEGFYAIDKDWHLTYLNSNAARLWKQTPQELTGTYFWNIFRPDYETTVGYQMHVKAAAERKQIRFETLSPNLGFWVEVVINPTSDGGLTVSFHDITGRKQDERNKAFLSDIRNDLAALTNIDKTMEQLGLKIGRFFDVKNCTFSELIDNNEISVNNHGWNAPDVTSLNGTYKMRDFLTDEQFAASKAGELSIVEDTQSDPRSYGAPGIRSFIIVPMVRNAKFAFLLSIIDTKPRVWSEDEIALVKELTVSVWTRLEQARADEVLHTSEERQRFLLGLSDTMRPLDDPYEIQNAASKLVGEYLQVARVMYAEVDLVRRTYFMSDNYARPGFPKLVGVYPYDDFGEATENLQRGEMSLANDVTASPDLNAPAKETLLKIKVQSFVAVPLIKGGRWVATFTVQHDAPHLWTSGELTIIRETAERTWATVERARVEEKLHESQIMLQSFYDTAPFLMGIGEIDEATNTLIAISANRMTAEFFGRQPEKIGGNSGTELGTPTDIESLWVENIHKSQREGVSVQFEYEDPRLGDEPCLNATIGIIGQGASGRTRYSFIAENVTKRKRAEDALRESEENLRAVTNLVPALLWQMNASGQEVTLNSGWLEYTGQTTKQILSGGWLDAVHSHDRPVIDQALEMAFQHEQDFEVVLRIRQNDGVYRYFLIRQLPVRNEKGQVVQWFGAATDINEQRLNLEETEEMVRQRTADLASSNFQMALINTELQKERQRLHLLSLRLLEVQETERRFLAKELHDEIGQFLTGLKLQLETNKRLSGEKNQNRDTVEKQFFDTIETVDELSTRVRELSLNLRPTLLDDMGVLPALTTLLARYTGQTGIKVNFFQQGLDQRFDQSIEITVYRLVQEALTNIARYARVKQALVNLVLENETIILLIQDEGVGFEREEVFSRRNSTGLSSMQERVELVEGIFTLESVPGLGTTILAEIPFERIPLTSGEDSGSSYPVKN